MIAESIIPIPGWLTWLSLCLAGFIWWCKCEAHIQKRHGYVDRVGFILNGVIMAFVFALGIVFYIAFSQP